MTPASAHREPISEAGIQDIRSVNGSSDSFDAAEEDVLRARINAYMTANRMLQERYDRYDRLRAGNM